MSFLLDLARSRLGGFVVGLVFAQFSFLIPGQKLWNSRTLIAFEHPRPAYPTHILLVPKRRISGLENLGAEDAAFIMEIFHTSSHLAAEKGLGPGEYELVVNAGLFQDVKQIHFHLISPATFLDK